jgi:hypothetical protein
MNQSGWLSEVRGVAYRKLKPFAQGFSFCAILVLSAALSSQAQTTTTINLAPGQANPTNISPVNFEVVFGEKMDPATFSSSDIMITGTSANATAATPITLDSISWIVSVFTTSPGTITAFLPAGLVTSFTLNTNLASTTSGNTVTFDNVVPTVTVNQAAFQLDPTNTNPMNFVVVFSRAIDPLSLAPADFTIAGSASSGAVVSALSTSDNSTWFISVTGVTTTGAITASLAANRVTDFVGNNNSASTSTDNSVFFSVGAPSALINQFGGQPDPASVVPLTFTINFSHPIDPLTFSPGDLTIGGTAMGGSAANLSTSNNQDWTVDVIGLTSAGTVTLSMTAGKVKNMSAIDNIASVSTDNTVRYNFPGSLTLTVEQDAGQADPAILAPVFFVVTFSEAIDPASFTSSDIILSGTAPGAIAGAPVSSNNLEWTVPITGMTASGTITMTVGSGTVQDYGLPPKLNAASTSLDNTVTYNDFEPPSLVSRTPGNGDLSFPSTADIVLTFNKLAKSYDRKLTLYRFSDHVPLVLDLATANPSVSTSFTYPTVVGAVSLLATNERYFILVPPGDGTVGFGNTSDVPFPGITSIPTYFVADNGNWVFKTADTQGPFVIGDFIDFKDISLLGGNLQFKINKVSTVYYLLTNVGDPVPTQDQIIDPLSGTPYGATPVSSGSYEVEQAYKDTFIPVNADLITSGQYTIYMSAVDAGNNRMGHNGVTVVGPEFLARDFTASDPPPGPFHPIISTHPAAYTLCAGDFQPLSYPITIVERNANDFSNGTVSFALPTGFEFNTSVMGIASAFGTGSAMTVVAEYMTSSIIRVTVSNTNPTIREKIEINGLHILARSSAVSGPILRLGGSMLPTIEDFSSFGTLVKNSIAVVTYQALVEGVDKTLVADNIPSVVLASDSVTSGLNVYTGNGVDGFYFKPIFAGIGSHAVTLDYSDVNGCSSQSTRTLRVYDHTRAINGLDTLYCTNNVSVRISSINYDGSSALDSIMVELMTPNSLMTQALAETTLTFSEGYYYFDPAPLVAAGEIAKLNNNLPAEGGTLARLKFTGRYVNPLGQIDEYEQVVTINVPPTTGLSFSAANLINDAYAYYCEDTPLIDIDGSPRPSEGFSIGSFMVNTQSFVFVNGFVDRDNGTGTISPSAMDPSTRFTPQQIRYTFKSLLTGCQNFTDSTIYIAPEPTASFVYSAQRCVDVPLNFTGLYSFDPAAPPALIDSVAFLWSFDDPQGNTITNTSDLHNPQHIYTAANTVIPSLVVSSRQGCESDPVSQPIQIGAIPVAAFTFAGLAGIDADFIIFNDGSTVFNDPSSSNSTIDYIRWNFGDVSQTVTTGFFNPLNHTFANTGTYDVSLTAHTDFGCVDSVSHRVVVLGKATVTEENFEGPSKWVPYAHDGNSSWQIGNSLSKSAISLDPVINGSNVWITSATDFYLPEETSALYSPVYDLTAFTRPVISFDNFTHIAGSDGVVLQYSVDSKNVADTTKSWNTLGIYDPVTPSGIGWYNALTLPSTPGGLAGNPAAYAWTGTSTAAWYSSKHSLEFLQSESQVVFRFALGSVTPDPSTDGFAMDNFRVAESNRIVLVENFTSTNVRNASEMAKVKNAADKVTSLVETGTSVVAINYHVDYNSVDPFNSDSPAGPSSRALFYSASTVPVTLVDGRPDPQNREIDLWVDASISFRHLDAPKLSIELINAHNTDSGSLEIDRVDIRANGFVDEAVLMVAVIESNIAASNPNLDPQYLLSGETNFNYVLKQFLPSAGGYRLDNITPGFTASLNNLNWAPPPNESYSNNFNIIAFVQDRNTKEIHQVVISPPLSITNSHQITGIEPAGLEWTVYPNPANKEFHVSRKNAGNIDLPVRLISQIGAVVEVGILRANDLDYVVNTEALSDGLYVLQAGEGAGAVRRKILVVH